MLIFSNRDLLSQNFRGGINLMKIYVQFNEICSHGSFAPSEKDDRIRRRISPCSPPPPTAKGGGGWGRPLQKLRQKTARRYNKHDSLHAFCTDMTSLCDPLAIEGHTDGDGNTKPASVAVHIEGAERGKEGGEAPAATTTAPEQPACLSGDACCKCGLQSLCKTTRCGCRRAGRNCVSCRCLVWCADVAPQTRQDKQGTT